MKLLSKARSLDLIALVCCAVALLGVLRTFVIGQHFVIPTLLLVLAVLLGNCGYWALRGAAWARYVLFWIFSVLSAHCFFALFWAKTPRAMLGEAFLGVYGAVFVFLSYATWQYARSNKLFAKQGN